MMAGNVPLLLTGKDKSAEQNADMCLFLEEWENNRESFQQYCMAKDAYEDWKDKNSCLLCFTGCRDERTGKSSILKNG